MKWIKRKNIIIFLIILVVLSSILNYFIIKVGFAKATILILAVMWVPAIATFLSLLLLKQSLKTIHWRIGKIKYLMQAFCIPLIYTTVAYIPLWLVGYFNAEKALTPQNLILPIAGAFINSIATLGEEIGWRGYLFPQLEKEMSFTKAALLTGFIWSVWHIPGLLLTDYGNNAPWFTSVPFFIITLTAISLPISYLCKKAKSIWPAVLFHGAHNAFIQAFYDPYSIKNATTQYLIGETGIALSITSIVLLLFFITRKTAPETT
jgi:uncharacterized protein